MLNSETKLEEMCVNRYHRKLKRDQSDFSDDGGGIGCRGGREIIGNRNCS